jgi:hypothetical protein
MAYIANRKYHKLKEMIEKNQDYESWLQTLDEETLEHMHSEVFSAGFTRQMEVEAEGGVNEYDDMLSAIEMELLRREK